MSGAGAGPLAPSAVAPPEEGGQPEATAPALEPGGYIVGRLYDWVFFLGSPLVALLVGWLISGSFIDTHEFEAVDTTFTPTTGFLTVFIHAHLFAVLFRSYGNKTVFNRFKIRFVVVPLFAYVGMVTSMWLLVCGSVLATFWDVYHSGMQTFGLGRIYDVRAGNDPKLGRKLDWIANQVLYAGPIFAGATMMDHVGDFAEFGQVEAWFFADLPIHVHAHSTFISKWLILGGAFFLAFYVLAYARMATQGYRVSWPKVFLVVTTGLVSVLAWGLNSWGQAFFIMNIFHAWQYFGLVWATENKNLRQRLHLDRSRLGKPVVLLALVTLCGIYGVFVLFLDTSWRYLWAFTLLISLGHFWYDGFIWSVRRKDV